MDVHELVAKVANELEAKGFEVECNYYYDVRRDHCGDSKKMYQVNAIKDGKAERRPVEGYNFSRFDGFRIEAYVVHRHNGAEENISVDISIYKYENSSGKRIAKERININMGERAIMSRINRIVEMYEAL